MPLPALKTPILTPGAPPRITSRGFLHDPGQCEP
jgi:hypothetical protein